MTPFTGTGEPINQEAAATPLPETEEKVGLDSTTSGEQKIQEPPIPRPRTQRLTRITRGRDGTLPPFPVMRNRNPQEKPETSSPFGRGVGEEAGKFRRGGRVVHTWSCSMGNGPCSTSSCCSAAALCCCAADDMTALSLSCPACVRSFEGNGRGRQGGNAVGSPFMGRFPGPKWAITLGLNGPQSRPKWDPPVSGPTRRPPFPSRPFNFVRKKLRLLNHQKRARGEYREAPPRSSCSIQHPPPPSTSPTGQDVSHEVDYAFPSPP
jgi:hypothetical protein